MALQAMMGGGGSTGAAKEAVVAMVYRRGSQNRGFVVVLQVPLG